MEITVKYLDEYGTSVTGQQCALLESYSKVTYIDNVIKKVEEFWLNFRNDDLRFVEYFVDRSENKQEVLKSYLDGKTACVLHFNDQNQNGFIQWDFEDYSKAGILKWKGSSVYDNANRIVMYCHFDLNTGALLDDAAKIFYSKEFDEVLLRVRYDNNGNAKYIEDPNYHLGSDGDHITLDEFAIYEGNFSWEQHPYFHSLKPYLPNSSEI